MKFDLPERGEDRGRYWDRCLRPCGVERLHGLFGRLAREFETALIVVTHNRALAGRADRVLSLEGGRLIPLSGVESMP